MKRVLTAVMMFLVMAATLVVPAQPAEAAVKYTCATWRSGGTAYGRCPSGSYWTSYRVSAYCQWWWGGKAGIVQSRRTYTPGTASVSCPFGSNATDSLLYSETPYVKNLAWS